MRCQGTFITVFSSPDSTWTASVNLTTISINIDSNHNNPQPSTMPSVPLAVVTGSSGPHIITSSRSSSKSLPLQNGQSVPLAPFQQHSHGKKRAEPPQTEASSQYASTLSHHHQFEGSCGIVAPILAALSLILRIRFCIQENGKKIPATAIDEGSNQSI